MTAVYAEVEAEKGAAFLPVLLSRSAAVDEFIEKLIPLLSPGDVIILNRSKPGLPKKLPGFAKKLKLFRHSGRR